MTTQDVSMTTSSFNPSAGTAVSLKAPIRIATTLVRWYARAKQRAELANFDETLRRDIGVSSADIWREINKPFWRE